ncbi:MAG: class I SAM-dependent methyltransferase, partial [Pseudomonadota bacterium]
MAAVEEARNIKGVEGVWGLWERMVPGLLHEEDAAGRRMLDIHLRRYRIAAQYVAGKRVLDIASGAGYGTRMLKDAGADFVAGVDLSDEAVAYADGKYGCDGVAFTQGNAEEFAFDEPFDVIVSFETLEHLPNPDRFLANAHAHLKPGGVLLLSAPIGETRHIDIYHLQVFERPDIYGLLADAGFEVEGYRFDPWKVTRQELFHWKKIYPESATPVLPLFFSWRGRKTIADAFLKGGVSCDMFMTASRKVEGGPQPHP